MNIDEIKNRIKKIDLILGDKDFLKKAQRDLKSERKDLEFLKSRLKKRYKFSYQDQEDIKKTWNNIIDSIEELEEKDLEFEIWRINFEDIKFCAGEILKIYEKGKIQK